MRYPAPADGLSGADVLGEALVVGGVAKCCPVAIIGVVGADFLAAGGPWMVAWTHVTFMMSALMLVEMHLPVINVGVEEVFLPM